MRPSDVAFTDAVKKEQAKRGTREGIEHLVSVRPWPVEIPPDLAGFIQARDSAYLGTASAEGRPYVQHRGGPRGFIKVLGPRELAFADYRGNRQYISLGNLAENDRAFLFLMDYAQRQRVKLWGRARFVEGDQGLIDRVRDPTYRGRVERVLVFRVETWSVNCPAHIVPRFTLEELLSRFTADELVELKKAHPDPL